MLRARNLFFVILAVLVSANMASGFSFSLRIEAKGREAQVVSHNAFDVKFLVGNNEIYAWDAYPLRGNAFKFAIQTYVPDGWLPSRAYYKIDDGKLHKMAIKPSAWARGKKPVVTIHNQFDNAVHTIYVVVYFKQITTTMDANGQLVTTSTEDPTPITVSLPVKHYPKQSSRHFSKR